MDIWNDSITKLAGLDMIPHESNLPPHELPPDALMGTLLNPAFDCETQIEADLYLRKLLIHWLRFGKSKQRERMFQKLTAKEAVLQIRAALWWFALAKDIGAGELFEMRWAGSECVKVERTKHRELVCQLFGATDQTRKLTEADILERVHLKRERAAKKAGKVYWRKQHTPTPTGQTSLF